MTCVMLGLAFTLTSVKTNPVHAAPSPPNPDFVDPIQESKSPTQEQRAVQQSIAIAPQPPAPPSEARKLGYFYKYRRALSVFYSAGADSKQMADGGDLLVQRFSLDALFPTENLRYLEAAADLQSDGSGALGLSYRWIFSRTSFRPYTKIGAALRIEPADQLAALLRFTNYQLRGSLGFEETLRDPLSIRFDAELVGSLRAVEAFAGLGLVWAW